jgi:hypothetical protein
MSPNPARPADGEAGAAEPPDAATVEPATVAVDGATPFPFIPVFWNETASSGPPPLDAPPENDVLSPGDEDLPPPLSHPFEPLAHAPKSAAAAARSQIRLMIESVDDGRRRVNPDARRSGRGAAALETMRAD